MRGDPPLHVVTRCGAPEFRQGSDSAIGNAAGHDQIEMGKVGGVIQCEPVTRHPALDPDADRGELSSPTHTPVSPELAGLDP